MYHTWVLHVWSDLTSFFYHLILRKSIFFDFRRFFSSGFSFYIFLIFHFISLNLIFPFTWLFCLHVILSLLLITCVLLLYSQKKITSTWLFLITWLFLSIHLMSNFHVILSNIQDYRWKKKLNPMRKKLYSSFFAI